MENHIKVLNYSLAEGDVVSFTDGTTYKITGLKKYTPLPEDTYDAGAVLVVDGHRVFFKTSGGDDPWHMLSIFEDWSAKINWAGVLAEVQRMEAPGFYVVRRSGMRDGSLKAKPLYVPVPKHDEE